MTYLIADIGATNARFAVRTDAGITATCVLPCVAYPSLAAAIEHYLGTMPTPPILHGAAICIAAAVQGDRITMTNHGWDFSITSLRQHFGWPICHVVNDFTAVALSLPHLKPQDYHILAPGNVMPNMPMAVLGPGTGLGVSGMIPTGNGWQPLSGEGGHVTLAARNDREAAILAIARPQSPNGHVSAEYFLCGSGLERLYRTIAILEGKDTVTVPNPATISNDGCSGTDPIAVETIALFCSFLGNVAGNLALTLGSTGGVWLAGGILPRWIGQVDFTPFIEAFYDKGRFRSYLDTMPVRLITDPFPAFIGLEALIRPPHSTPLSDHS